MHICITQNQKKNLRCDAYDISREHMAVSGDDDGITDIVDPSATKPREGRVYVGGGFVA